jgi:hypothetical protein
MGKKCENAMKDSETVMKDKAELFRNDGSYPVGAVDVRSKSFTLVHIFQCLLARILCNVGLCVFPNEEYGVLLKSDVVAKVSFVILLMDHVYVGFSITFSYAILLWSVACNKEHIKELKLCVAIVGN